eukprot:gene23981-31131_t
MFFSSIQALLFNAAGTKSFLCYPKYTFRMMSKKNDIRPTIDDVERISRGQAAKRRGTGSRSIPHRLNAEERIEWEYAKLRRYLNLRGTGWRKERGDSPLANIYRNYCDAVGIPSIRFEYGSSFKLIRIFSMSVPSFSSIMRGIGNTDLSDRVIVDFSPLREKNVASLVAICDEEASKYSGKVSSIDNSNLDNLGWGDMGKVFEEEPIWRIPVFSYEVTFSVRSDSKKFAEAIAGTLAGGTTRSGSSTTES